MICVIIEVWKLKWYNTFLVISGPFHNYAIMLRTSLKIVQPPPSPYRDHVKFSLPFSLMCLVPLFCFVHLSAKLYMVENVSAVSYVNKYKYIISRIAIILCEFSPQIPQHYQILLLKIIGKNVIHILLVCLIPLYIFMAKKKFIVFLFLSSFFLLVLYCLTQTQQLLHNNNTGIVICYTV